MEVRSQTVYCIAILFTFMVFFCQCLPRKRHDSNSQLKQCFESPLATSVNDFGSSLLKNVEEDGNNIFVSPLSIYIALAMTYLGAKGQTAREIEETLLFSKKNFETIQFHEALRNLLSSIDSKKNEYNLHLANGMFIQQDFNIENQYQENMRKFYQAVVKTVDFANSEISAKEEINKFVSEGTHNMIDAFLKEPLSRDTVLALLNAVYFKGTWKIQFPANDTIDGTFKKTEDDTKKVEYMRLSEEKFRFFEDRDNNYKFLELPYKGGDISMILALPIDKNQSPDLEMNSDLLCRINDSLQLKNVRRIWLPKFQLRYEKELTNVLKQLGIRDLFDSADLTGIRREGDIEVSTVEHEAVIDVNEEGSEASAVTGVIISVKSSFYGNEFIADHPFSFYIVDNRNGLILFSGRVFDP